MLPADLSMLIPGVAVLWVAGLGIALAPAALGRSQLAITLFAVVAFLPPFLVVFALAGSHAEGWARGEAVAAAWMAGVVLAVTMALVALMLSATRAIDHDGQFHGDMRRAPRRRDR